MNTRERFHALLDFQPVDRLPMLEWASWWTLTRERWISEGMPELDGFEMYKYFGLDLHRQMWVGARMASLPRPPAHGAGIFADNAGYAENRRHLFPAGGATADFLRKWEAFTAEQATGDCLAWFTFDGFFWLPRELLGIERHLYAFYDQPGLMHAINDENADWMLRTIDAICSIGTPDFMTFAEDMSYNNGPMLSEALFDEFLLPYYRRVIPELRRRGIRVVIDSDGDITRAAPWFERAGIEGILPLERQAGVDLARLRAAHPRMCFIGHYDKMAMPHGEDAMRAEFERLLPVMRGGGFIPSVDHQTPPGVSLENYRAYLRLLREYVEKAACTPRPA